ncbi:MAG TPA: hypothetical protein VHV82_15710 [Sporichthyaceae bacterium]|jgi:hypothetical protein|nr:hypothetical protein [Sporichthyaceae bacterium]
MAHLAAALVLVFVATGDRAMFGSPDLAALKAVLGVVDRPTLAGDTPPRLR